MANRIINFFDGSDSSTTPTLGNISASDLVKYADDATFEATEAGAPIGGNIYYNTTTDTVRYYRDDLPGWVTVLDDNVVDSTFQISDDGDTSKKMKFEVSGVTTATTRTFTVPDEDTTLVGTAATQSLTNKTIDADNNTISNLEHGNEVDNPSSGVHGVTGSVVGTTDSQTLSGKTFSDDTDFTSATTSTNTTTGAVTVTGGVGIGENLNVGGDATITGDLTVSGTTTTLDNETLQVTDANITVNDGGTQANANTNHAGITVEMSDATDADVGYDSALASKFHCGEVGSEEEIITANHQQRITNKDIDLGTATNDDGITVSKATTATLTALTREAGRVYYSTDELTYYGDDGTQLIPMGGGEGGGALNFYENGTAETATTGDFTTGNNATFDGGGSLAGTFSVSTTAADLIRGDKSFKYVQSATAANNDDDYIASEVIAVPQGYRGRFLALKMQYRSDAASGNIKMVVEDNTNTAILTDGTETLENYEDATDNTAKEFNIVFYCPADCATLKIGPQVITGEVSKTLVWDDVIVTPDAFVSKDIGQVTSYAAKIANGGSASITSQSNPDNPSIASVNRTAAGLVTINLTPGLFTVAPAVDGSINDTVASTDVFKVLTVSTTVITIATLNHTSTAIDSDFSINIHKQGVDSQPFTENVIHNSTGTENDFSAVIANGGSASITSQSRPNNPSIASVNRTAAGLVTINLTSGYFAVAPAVDGCINDTVASTDVFKVLTVSTSTITIATLNHTSTAVDSDFTINIHRQGTDYRDPQAFAITPLTRSVHLRDEKSANTAGGTFTSGAWQTRDLNTSQGDVDVATISSNQFTLQPGKYEIDASAPAYKTDLHKAKLRNITDSTDDIIGTSEGSHSADNSMTRSIVKGTITVTTPTTYEIQHRCATTKATDGYGFASNFGVVEVYTEVKVTKLK